MSQPLVENIEETTVGDVDGERVPMASMVLDAEYELPDGSKARGVTCILVIGEQNHWVGLGSQVSIGGRTWEVVGIHKESGEPGNVDLRRLDD